MLNQLGHNEIVVQYHRKRLNEPIAANQAENVDTFTALILQAQTLNTYKSSSIIAQTGIANALQTTSEPSMQAQVAHLAKQIGQLTSQIAKINVGTPMVDDKPTPATYFCSTHGKNKSHVSNDCKRRAPEHNLANNPTNWSNKAQWDACMERRTSPPENK